MLVARRRSPPIEKNLPWGRRLTRPLGVVADPGRRLRGRRVSRGIVCSAMRGSTTAAAPRPAPSAATGRPPTPAPSILAAARDAPAGRRLREPLDPARRRGRRGPAQPDPLPLRQQAAAHPGRPRGRERAAPRAPADDVRRRRSRCGVQWERACDFLDDRPRVGLRPDPPGDDRRRLVRCGGRGGRPRDDRRLVPAAGRGRASARQERRGGPRAVHAGRGRGADGHCRSSAPRR